MNFRIELSASALKNHKKLDRKTRERLKKAFDEMVKNPFQGVVVKLKGYEAFKRRVGSSGIVFIVSFSDAHVFIVDILPRGEAYKNL